MPASARSKLCSSVSAWSGVFASIAMSSAQSVSVIVFCGVPSASFLRQLEAILSDFVNRCSKYVVQTDDKEVRVQRVPLQYSCYNVEVFCVSIWCSYFYFGVSMENRYCCYGFFRYAVRQQDLFHLSSVNGIELMSLVGFLPVHLQGFYGWLIFMRSWIYFFGSHFGFS